MDEDKAMTAGSGHVIGQDISLMSVDELEAVIAGLREEIARLEAEIGARAASRTAADAVFQK